MRPLLSLTVLLFMMNRVAIGSFMSQVESWRGHTKKDLVQLSHFLLPKEPTG